MPIVLSYGDVLRVLVVIKQRTPPASLPFSGPEYTEDEESLKILSRVAAKFGELESRRVQSHLLFEYSFPLSCVLLSFSLFLSLYSSLFNCFH